MVQRRPESTVDPKQAGRAGEAPREYGHKAWDFDPRRGRLVPASCRDAWGDLERYPGGGSRMGGGALSPLRGGGSGRGGAGVGSGFSILPTPPMVPVQRRAEITADVVPSAPVIPHPPAPSPVDLLSPGRGGDRWVLWRRMRRMECSVVRSLRLIRCAPPSPSMRGCRIRWVKLRLRNVEFQFPRP